MVARAGVDVGWGTVAVRLWRFLDAIATLQTDGSNALGAQPFRATQGQRSIREPSARKKNINFCTSFFLLSLDGCILAPCGGNSEKTEIHKYLY
jgi:hypothetical protein